MACIHIVDDDHTIREMLNEYFDSKGHEVRTFPNAELAVQELVSGQPDVLLLDVRLPGMDGLTFLKNVSKQIPGTGIIMMTGHADYQTAVQAMKNGAKDFVSKPFSLTEIEDVVGKVMLDKTKRDELDLFKEANLKQVNEMVGSSEPMKAVFSFVEKVASSSKTSVLIGGETGTGKGMVARAIHYRSPRKNAPFVEINCSAFQTSLLESELFGYEAGAFTGAKTRKKGLLELAHGGTFFLDEVGDMSLELQSKLLKVLEEQSFRRVGGTKEIRIDTRIISATSRDLDQLVVEENFRTDLYYRLHVASISLPPLRDRGEDIHILALHFLAVFARELKKPIGGFSPEARKALYHHPWIGNVRELKNVIERAVLFESGPELTLSSIGLPQSVSLPDSYRQSLPISPEAMELPAEGFSFEELERNILKKAMKQSRGNKSKAAKLLGFSRETMKYRLKKFNLDQYG
jgi:two-component system response regulator AtoC